MAEVNVVATEPIVNGAPSVKEEKAPVSEKQAETKVDLATRVSEYKTPVETPKPTNEFGLTAEDYEKVKTDPVLSKFYKSMESGVGKKFQEVAELRKSYETKLGEMSTWTPDRVKNLLNDNTFVQAAQRVAESQAPASSGLSDQEWSSLSDTDKVKFRAMETRQLQMEQLLFNESQKREDEKLKTKYKDYAPDIVDTTISKLQKKEIQATREDVWKIINYDSHMQRAYELGKQDAKTELGDKRSASSYDGLSTITAQETITPEKGESNQSFFRRIVMNRLAQNKK